MAQLRSSVIGSSAGAREPESQNMPATVIACGRPHASGNAADTTSAKLFEIPQVITMAGMPATRHELVAVRVVRVLLERYISLVKKTIADSVPKAIICFLVTGLKEAIQSECISALYKESLFDELLREAPNIQIRRNTCAQEL